MSVTKEDLDRFHDFAVAHVSAGQSEFTWLQLFELWRLENPSAVEHGENAAAIQEALEAMDAGCMRPFSAFDSDFRRRRGIIDEIHRTRERMAEKFGGDIAAIVEDARKRQAASGRPVWQGPSSNKAVDSSGQPGASPADDSSTAAG